MKKKTDEKQDEIINQLKKNQEKIVEAIEFNPAEAITWKGEKLPALDYHYDEDEGEGEGEGEGEDEGEGEGEEIKPSTSEKKPQSLNIDKGISPEYVDFLEDKGLPKPSEIFEKGIDPSQLITKVKSKIKRNEEYIESHSTKKGQPLKNLKKIQLTTYKRHKVELPYLKDYLVRLGHIQAVPKYMGKGIYTQKKRNAYKISQNGQ